MKDLLEKIPWYQRAYFRLLIRYESLLESRPSKLAKNPNLKSLTTGKSSYFTYEKAYESIEREILQELLSQYCP